MASRLAGQAVPARLPDRPRVLLVRPDHLGDLLMSAPAVELLRKMLPHAHLTMMVGPWGVEIARRDPLLDEVLTCPFPGFTREPKGSAVAPYRLLWKTARELRRGRYDAVLLLRFDHWWGAWMAALAGTPVRVGHGVPECLPFLTHVVEPVGRGPLACGARWCETQTETAGRCGGGPARSPSPDVGGEAAPACAALPGAGAPNAHRASPGCGMLPTSGHWVEQSLAVAEELLVAWGVGGNAGFSSSLGRAHEGLKSLPRIDSEPAGSLPRKEFAGVPRGLGLRFALTEEDEAKARRLVVELGLSTDRPLVAFHPGTGSPLKLWLEERWVGLGRTLASRGAQVVVTGSPAESRGAERIAGAIPDAHSLAGRTDLGSLAALFRRCNVVVGVDSGPLHLAVAVGVSTVHLFGPTDPALFGPWGDPALHRVVKGEWPGAPCGRLDLAPPSGEYAGCMESISLDRVVAECEELLWGRR